MKIKILAYVYVYVKSGDRGNSLCPIHRVIQFGDQPDHIGYQQYLAVLFTDLKLQYILMKLLLEH